MNLFLGTLPRTASMPARVSCAGSLLTRRMAVVGVALGLSAGCASVRPVPWGLIETPKVEIRALDGSFTLRSGQKFAPPFTANCHDVKPERFDPLVAAYDYAQENGARRVIVRVPWRRKPLRGILWLCGVRETAYGPGARSYRIMIGRNHVEATSAHRVSAIFEIAEWFGSSTRDLLFGRVSAIRRKYAWFSREGLV